MADQSSEPQKDKTSAPSQKTPGADEALREDWKKLSKGDQDTYFQSLSAKDQDEFARRVGLWDSKTPVHITAPPKTGSIPWMKQKAYATLNWGANQLPTVEGVVGGVVGGILGEVADPAGGGAPGAIIGAGIGGASGEAHRQRIQDWSGYNQFEDPEDKTVGHRTLAMVKEGLGQAAGEASGQLLGKWLRPTLERSLSKLYYAGKLKYGDPMRSGDLESVINDVMATEKANKTSSLGGSPTNKAVTVGDFLSTISQTKEEIGKAVDQQLAIPFQQNGKTVMLGKAEADMQPIVAKIKALATVDPSIVKRAAVDKGSKEAAYLEKVKREVLAFSQKPWTYEELTKERIRLNTDLRAIYPMTSGEQRVYLLEHPEMAIKKAEADAIREVVYPQMDAISKQPAGTTAALQNKRGALMSLEDQVKEHLANIKTKARQAKGAPPMEKVNISSYGTSAGKPGFAVHRLTGLVHTPNPEAKADAQVAKAFGNTVGTKFRKGLTTPAGSEMIGNELLALPLRELVNPSMKKPQDKEDDQTPPGPQSSVAKPRDLIEKAKALNPAAQGQVAYTHTAVNPKTGHVIGARGGKWYDVQTGQQIA